MIEKLSDTSSNAEAIALQMLGFLASDESRLESFLNLTGIAPQELRQLATDPQFLGGVMDHLLADQSSLLAFCEDAGITPESVLRARRHLPGATDDF